jgi:hypothetical protein
VAVAVALAALASARASRADLRDAVDRVAEAWRAVGAAVAVDRTRFLTDDNDDQRPIMVALPDLPEGACTTVVVLGARGLGFHVRVREAEEPDDPGAKRLSSVAGVLSIERCGVAPPRRIIVAADSGRGAIETLVARSSKPLPSLRSVLPERSGGAVLPVSEPGALPPLAPPDKRAEIAEVRAKRDGAAIALRATWQAGLDGTGSGEQTLVPGCHTVRLYALDPRAGHPTRRGKLDLDAEMRDLSDDRVLARDRSDAPDAELAACVGETTHVEIVFAGSPPSSPVLVAHFAWGLPDHLPASWGPEPRARLAHVLLARHVVSLPREPVMLAQGASGVTPIPFSIEPGACYLGVIARVRETARAIGLRIHVGADDAVDDRGVDGDGAAVAFCAGSRTHAVAEVQARGAPLLGWGFALYRLQAGVWEVSR